MRYVNGVIYSTDSLFYTIFCEHLDTPCTGYPRIFLGITNQPMLHTLESRDCYVLSETNLGPHVTKSRGTRTRTRTRELGRAF